MRRRKKQPRQRLPFNNSNGKSVGEKTTSSEVAFQQKGEMRRGKTTSSEVAFQLFNKLFGIIIFQWFKNIPFIIIDPEQFQETQIFVVKCLFCMMRLLILNIICNGMQL